MITAALLAIGAVLLLLGREHRKDSTLERRVRGRWIVHREHV